MKYRYTLPLALALLQGCATYQAAPLPSAPAFPAAAQPALPAEGLDITEVATLAVLNNPDLRAARLGLRVTAAQAFSAGLLPDPQLNLTHDFPVASTLGASSAFLVAIGYSVNALLTHSTLSEASEGDQRQAALNLEWQEWQVIAQARLLFVRLQAAAAHKALLDQTRTLLAGQYTRTRSALSAGLLTLDAVTPHLTALQDVERQLSDLERQTNQARFDLRTLLGLPPGAALVLRDGPGLPGADAQALDAQLPALLAVRPDIQALRAGYAAQDARYRVALLSQFPAFTFGLQRARDTSNVYTRGFSVNLTLPLFNGGRGEIRVQDATRDKLRAEYQQRLDAGSIDVHRVLAEQDISLRQLADVDQALLALHAARDRLRAAFAAHGVDALTLTTLESATLAKESERVDALQAIQEQRIALLTLVGNSRDARSDGLHSKGS